MIATSPEGLDDNDDVTVIQALALLAVIDATGRFSSELSILKDLILRP